MRRLSRRAVAWVGLAAGALGVGLTIAATDRPSLTVSGPASGAAVASDRVAFRVATGSRSVAARSVEARLDGRRVATRGDGHDRIVSAAGLAEGRHVLEVRATAGGLVPRSALERRVFTVDTVPPRLEVPATVLAASLAGPVSLAGRVSGATALRVDGAAVAVREGRFDIRRDGPSTVLRVEARDVAGNLTRREVVVVVRHPGMRAVHLTALAWTAPRLRDPVLALARAGKIDTVELDVKDESGEVGYASRVPLARTVGAAKGRYHAPAVLRQLHGMRVRVVGRLVAFRDPLLARWAWRSGRRAMVVQTPRGTPYVGKGRYGPYPFTNPAHPAVRRYNIDLALEATRLGFDDVLYDYVRRPDGPLASMRLPGLRGTPEAAVAGFLAETHPRVRAAGGFLGASIYGVAARRPRDIAQHIPSMARRVDYVAPMVYPSHWSPGH